MHIRTSTASLIKVGNVPASRESVARQDAVLSLLLLWCILRIVLSVDIKRVASMATPRGEL